MNEQLTRYDFSDEIASSTLNTTLISMQIQALRESLRRLTEPEDAQFELPDVSLVDQPVKPSC